MRFLLSAALAASVSFAALAPANACGSSCSPGMGSGSGSGGGSVSSTTDGGTSAQTSNTSDGSSESENHGLPGHGSSSAGAVFRESANDYSHYYGIAARDPVVRQRAREAHENYVRNEVARVGGDVSVFDRLPHYTYTNDAPGETSRSFGDLLVGLMGFTFIRPQIWGDAHHAKTEVYRRAAMCLQSQGTIDC